MAWYQVNRERLLTSVKSYIETELSHMTGQTVSIETIELSFPGSLVLGNITVSSPGLGPEAARIRSVTVAPEILPLVTKFHVASKMTVKGFSSGNISSDLKFRTLSRQCQKWEDAIDPALLDSITVLDGSLALGGYKVNGIKGSLDLDNTVVMLGHMDFTWKGNAMTADFSEIPGTNGAYQGTLASPDFTVEASLSAGMDILEIKRFRGVIFSIGMDLEGMVLCFNSDNKIYEFTGTVGGDIKDLASMLSGSKKLKNILAMQGSFLSRIDISVSERDVQGLSLDADISSRHMTFGKIEAGDIYGKLSVSGGEARIYDMKFNLMDSPTSIDISLDMNDESLPLAFNIETSGMDIDTAINTVSGRDKDNYGALDLKASFSGSGRDLSILADTVAATGFLPRNGNLFGTMTMKASMSQGKFQLEKARLDDIAAEISLDESVLRISSLDFSTFGGSFRGKADLNLSDPRFPLSLETVINGMDSQKVYGNVFGAGDMARGPLEMSFRFKGYGEDLNKAFKKAREKSRFTRLPVTDTVCNYLDILVKENRSGDADLDGSVKMAGLHLAKADLGDISVAFSIKEGALSIPTLDFGSFGGYFRGKADARLSEAFFPYSLGMKISGMDSSKVLRGVLGLNADTQGNLYADVVFSGYGRDIPLAIKDPRAYFAGLLKEKRINEIGLSSTVRLEKVTLNKFTLRDLSLGISVRDGILDISELGFRIFEGSFRGKAGLDLNDEEIPFSVDAGIAGMDSAEVFDDLLGIDNLVHGSMDADISLTGPGQDLWDLLKNLPAKNKPGIAFSRLKETGLLKAIGLYSSINMESIHLPKVELDDLHAVLSSYKGVVNISSLGFKSFGGTFEGKTEFDLLDRKLPLDLEARLKGMDSTGIAENFLNIKDVVEGPMDLALSFKGHGSYLSEAASRVKLHDWKAKASFQEKIRSFLIMLSDKMELASQKLAGEVALRTVKTEKLRIDDLRLQFLLDKEHLSLPVLTSSFYKGTVDAEVDFDLADDSFPFRAGAKVSDADFRAIVRSVADPESPSYGRLDLNVKMKGELDNMSSYTGSGEINISRANLGPMPILAPLLGGLYESLQKIFPAFKKIDITSAWATFNIRDSKITTDNLVLAGNDICIASEGYMGFDGKLDFSFVNELIEPETETEENWPDSIRNFVTSFGKSVSRAKLKGTVKKQKWEFEYLAPISRNIENNVKAFFQGLSR